MGSPKRLASGKNLTKPGQEKRIAKKNHAVPFGEGTPCAFQRRMTKKLMRHGNSAAPSVLEKIKRRSQAISETDIRTFSGRMLPADRQPRDGP